MDLVTSDGVKKTACLAEIAMKTAAQTPATWDNAKPDALIVLNATWLENLAWRPVTSDGVRITADIALRILNPVTKLNGMSAVPDVLTASNAMALTWMVMTNEETH